MSRATGPYITQESRSESDFRSGFRSAPKHGLDVCCDFQSVGKPGAHLSHHSSGASSGEAHVKGAMDSLESRTSVRIESYHSE